MIVHFYFDGWHEWVIGKQGGNQVRIGLGAEGWYFVARIGKHLILKSGEYGKTKWLK